MKAIAFFDLETTGVDTENDRIVQVAIQVYNENYEILETYCTLVNPKVHIPEEAAEIHGITDETVKDAPVLAEVMSKIANMISCPVVSGYNIERFDVPLLMAEFDRNNFQFDFTNIVILDVFKIHNVMNPRTLGAVYKNYIGTEMEDAHDANADVTATKDVFLKLIEVHELKEMSLHDLRQLANNNKPVVDVVGKFTVNKDGDFAFNFGKNAGKNVLDYRDYLKWMLNGAFPSDTKNWCKKFLKM